MTLRVGLHISGDSTDAQNAVAKLDQAMAGADRSAADLAAGLNRTGAASGALAQDAARTSAALGRLSADQVQMARGGQEVVTNVGSQRAGMQQLAMQLNDVSTMFALGARPMQIFASQSGQIIQSVQLMTGGTSKLAGFLGGPWGIAITSAALVLTPLIGKLFETADAANAANAALKALRDQRLAAEQEALIVTDGLKRYNDLTRERARLESEIARASGGRKNPDGTPMFAYRQQQALLALQKEQKELSEDIQYGLRKTTGTIEDYTKTTDRATKSRHKMTDAEKAAKKALADAARAAKEAQGTYDQLVETAKSHAEQLEDQAAKYGKSALEIQRMEVVAKAAAAPTAELAKRIREAGTALEGKQIAKAADDFDKMVLAIYGEVEALGLVGAARDTAALQLERDGKMAEWTAQGLTDLENKWLSYAAARLTGIETKSSIERDLEAAAILKDRIDALIGSLGRMGGLGGILGDLGGVLTSDNPIASLLGMGGVGTIAGSLLGGSDITDKMGIEFTKSIKTTFPGLNEELAGKIGTNVAQLFQGAAIGGATGAVLGGGKNAQAGSQLGGAAGMAIAGPVGAIAGAILGNVIGGLTQATKRGGATFGPGGISGTWGNSQSRIGAASDLGTSALGALEQIASSLGVTLGSFSSSVSVREGNLRFDPTGSGISKTSKGAIDFGQDEEALLKAFIADAISDGAFKGLSEGFKAYLTSGDVEKRLQDVLSIRAARDELKSLKDPQGYQLGNLDTQFDELRRIATATGEGLAEIEELYGLRRKDILAQFTEDASDIERQRRQAEIELLAATGREAEALGAARAMELEGLPAAIRAIKEQTFAALDATSAENALAAARGAAAAEARQNFETAQRLQAEIFRLQGNEAQAVKVERQLELLAMTESLRPLLLRKYALQAEADAAATAAAAAGELARQASAIADERYSLETRLFTAMGNTAALRARELEQLAPANRGLLSQIFAIEDQKTAAEESARAIQAQTQALAASGQQFRRFADDLRRFRGELVANENDPAAALASARSQYLAVAGSARRGESAGLEQFTGAARGFLDVSLKSASSFLDYRRDVARVAGAADLAIAAAEGSASASEQQIALMTQVASSSAANAEGTLDLTRTIKELERAQTTEIVPEIQDTLDTGFERMVTALAALRAEMAVLRENMNSNAAAVVPAVRDIDDKLSRWDRSDHMAVTNDTDTPLTTTVAA